MREQESKLRQRSVGRLDRSLWFGVHVIALLIEGAGWAHFGHTHCPKRSIPVNHNRCHFAAQCRFGSETSIPKRVRFPAASTKRAVEMRPFL